jgi:hypothetical protein
MGGSRYADADEARLAADSARCRRFCPAVCAALCYPRRPRLSSREIDAIGVGAGNGLAAVDEDLRHLCVDDEPKPAVGAAAGPLVVPAAPPLPVALTMPKPSASAVVTVVPVLETAVSEVPVAGGNDVAARLRARALRAAADERARGDAADEERTRADAETARIDKEASKASAAPPPLMTALSDSGTTSAPVASTPRSSLARSNSSSRFPPNTPKPRVKFGGPIDATSLGPAAAAAAGTAAMAADAKDSDPLLPRSGGGATGAMQPAPGMSARARLRVDLSAAMVRDALHAKATIRHNIAWLSRAPDPQRARVLWLHGLLLDGWVTRLFVVLSWAQLLLCLVEAPTAIRWATTPGSWAAWAFAWPTVPVAELLFLTLHSAHLFARYTTGELHGMRLIAPVAIGSLSAADTLWALLAPSGSGVHHYRLAARLVRPFFLSRYSRLLKDSLEIVADVVVRVYKYALMIGAFVCTYGAVGWILFRAVDPDNFGSLSTAILSMGKLLTAANFPDVMLQADDAAGASSWVALFFFLSYVLMGLLFLLNFVLAVVYKHYNIVFKDSFVHKIERVDGTNHPPARVAHTRVPHTAR